MIKIGNGLELANVMATKVGDELESANEMRGHSNKGWQRTGVGK